MTKKATPRTTQRDIRDALTSFAARERIERIPERVRALAKLHIIDGIGVMLAGTGAPAARTLQRRLVAESGTAEVVGAKRTASPPLASFVNALSARVLDYDDVQTTETSVYGLLAHPTVPVLAAALAVGQARNVSGAALLAAYLVGVEATARLAASVDARSLRDGVATTATFGGIGALLAAAKLLGLRPKAMRAALAFWESTMARDGDPAEAVLDAARRDAHAVRLAVEAALLAADGRIVDAALPPSRSVLATLPATAAKRLGKPYNILQPGFAIRVYPCHPLTHPTIDLVLAIVNLHDLRAAAIERIEIGITRVMADVLSLAPPADAAELRRCLPFAAALAAAKGVAAPGDFARLPRATAVRDLIGRVRCRVDPELDALGTERARTVVRVTLKSGRVIQMKADVAKGTPQKPLSEIELFHKFFQCALPTLGEREAERLLNRLWLLDEAPHVAGLCRLDVRWPTDVRPGADGDHKHDHDHDDAHGRGHHAHLGHDDPDHVHGQERTPATPPRRKAHGNSRRAAHRHSR